MEERLFSDKLNHRHDTYGFYLRQIVYKKYNKLFVLFIINRCN
nr:MAG TPA: Chitin synthase [Caudoviricetes sp.]